MAPLLLESRWAPPSAPVPVGDGAVHADLIEQDRETFERMWEALAADLGHPNRVTPELLAAEAQAWRLPVTPYRRRSSALRRLSHQSARRQPNCSHNDPFPEFASPNTSPPSGRDTPGGCGGSSASPQSEPLSTRAHQRHQRAASKFSGSGAAPLVVDLSALWAGPLATMLLADLGARVVRIDSSVRPDGLRRHVRMYDHLNSVKEIVDIDLGTPQGRNRFEALLERADLLVHSFSRRVMPNLGYSHAHLAERYPTLGVVAITAFESSTPEADWISYGPGVHALMGLGDKTPSTHTSAPPSGTPAFEAAPLAYPDALAGFVAFAAGAALITGTHGNTRREVSLAASVAPLLGYPAATPGGRIGLLRGGRSRV